MRGWGALARWAPFFDDGGNNPTTWNGAPNGTYVPATGDTAWRDVTFTGVGWGNFPGSIPCQFRKDSDGIVHLKGVAAGGSPSFSPIFTLPAGYLPNQTNAAGPAFIVLGSQGGVRSVRELDISSNGDVLVTAVTVNGVTPAGTQDFITLDGVSFYADA